MPWRYSRQEWTGKVWELTDSNWAACPVTRKSSSATYLMLGKHPIFAASSTQTILSWSSGEAEFYEAVRCACRTLGLQSLMSDLSLEVNAERVKGQLSMQGVCSRRGAVKIRHVHCPVLWLQHPVGGRQIAITRRAGKDIALDVGRDQGGHPRRHHVATAGHVCTGQGRRSSEASVEHGRSGSEGLMTWLRYVCTTLSESQF